MSTSATVGELVVERPSRARIFERFGIDYCCAGKLTLQESCHKKGLDIARVTRELDAEADSAAPPEQHWDTASLTALADHIEQTHHAYLKRELPRLDTITEKVARVHGPRYPELVQLRNVFVAFQAELLMHMAKEEQVLFPLCRTLDRSGAPVAFHCGSVQNPIAVMVREHEDAGEALDQMRTLTGGYLPPPDACNTFRIMLASLAELEQDMHVHVHKENHILFPAAAAKEQLAQSAA